MKRSITLFLVCSLFILLIPFNVTHAEVEDGMYEVNYEIIHAENESASIANDYFEKPAVLLVKDGEQYVRFQINHSDYVKEIQLPEGDDYVDAEKKEENADEETFDAILHTGEDIFQTPIMLKMHIVVEDVDPPIDYNPTARFDFDEESVTPYEGEFSESDILPEALVDETDEESAENIDNHAEGNEEVAEDTEENQAQTSEATTNTLLYIWIGIGLLILIIAVVLLRRKK